METENLFIIYSDGGSNTFLQTVAIFLLESTASLSTDNNFCIYRRDNFISHIK